jgi:hypothetical protein
METIMKTEGKVFTCKICGEEVSKRQSYAFENGRACKKHQEVIDETTKRQAYEKAQRERVIEHKQFKRKQKAPISKTKPICFHCGKEGILEFDIINRVVINMEKVKITESKIYLPMFDGWEKMREMIQKDFGVEEIVSVNIYPVNHLEGWQLNQLIKNDFRMAVDMTQRAILCNCCAEEFGLKTVVVQPKISMETAGIVGAIMQDEINNIAAQELLFEGE